jgi:hypothetical protein
MRERERGREGERGMMEKEKRRENQKFNAKNLSF